MDYNMGVDRSYLPYARARQYRDRGMAKWMGMYLSEHTLALKRDKQRSDSSPIQAEK